jgi:putative tryptophan/tyrosine transport system substrate-binding protein
VFDIGRRDFITLLGGAASAWPLAVRAQQAAMPVIGFLHAQSPEAYRDHLRGFRQGLKETGYAEGENVVIVYRFAENQIERLPTLASELVRRPVAVIVTIGGVAAALAAKAATTTIPIVFGVAENPVTLGLVGSLARPGGNATGINFFVSELAAKRLGLLHELIPAATRVAVLVNPSNAASTDSTLRDIGPAARGLGLQLQVLNASTGPEIDAAFAAIVRERHEALFVAPDAFFLSRKMQLAHLASRHAVPTTFALRDFAEAGGLMSYGTSLTDAYRQMGVCTGSVLKGAKPADLAVVQATKFELIINRVTARILGLEVPPSLLATADEVIE